MYDLIASHGDVEDLVFFAVLMQGTVKFLNFQTLTNFTANTLKFKLKGSTIVSYL